MSATDDTIVAVATPPGRGALAVVRLSGPLAHGILEGLAGRSVTLTARRSTVLDLAGVSVRDTALATLFPAPASYTGQDVVELSLHGSPVAVAAVVDRAVALGARPALAGEFTLRAFVNGKLDLLQAEAVQEIVMAQSPDQASAAVDQLHGGLSAPIRMLAERLQSLHVRLEASLDFPEEGYRFIDRDELVVELEGLQGAFDRLVAAGLRGRVIRDGYRVAIVGAPNVGKSRLFNLLVGSDRAIVADQPGTTRDLVSARIVVAGGGLVEFVDTAGMRETSDVVEMEGVRRSREAARAADAVVLVLDRSRPPASEDVDLFRAWAGVTAAVVVANKCDLPDAWHGDVAKELGLAHAVSALSGDGVDGLVDRLLSMMRDASPETDEPRITNARHLRLLREAGELVSFALHTARSSPDVAEEFVAADVQLALRALEELSGVRTPDDVLKDIFSRFCIGK